MSALAAPRMPKVVIGEALGELRAREHRLTAALAEVRHAIGTLQDAIEVRQPIAAADTDGAPAVALRTPDATPFTDRERDAVVLDAIREHQPCARATLLAVTGLTIGRLKPSIERLMEDGGVRRLGEKSTSRYWTTEALDRYVAEHNRMPDGTPA